MAGNWKEEKESGERDTEGGEAEKKNEEMKSEETGK